MGRAITCKPGHSASVVRSAGNRQTSQTVSGNTATEAVGTIIDAVDDVSLRETGGDEPPLDVAVESGNTDEVQIVQQPATSSNTPSKKRRLGDTVSQSSSSSEGKFHGTNVEDIIILEICAGSARLTKTARAFGFKGDAVDHSIKRCCGVDISVFDLTDSAQLNDLLEYIRKDSDRIALVWIAPPCGTASRARERPIPGFESAPKPLRSAVQPDALDGLSGLDKYKVEMANQLYDAVLLITECAVSLDICVAIENPSNSHYWSATPTRRLIEEFGDQRVTFHACANGGSRDKLTTIWQSTVSSTSILWSCDAIRSTAIHHGGQ